MSMFSLASSRQQPGLATVSRNGYRLTTTRSIVGKSCSESAERCAATSRRARMPAWTFGCSVLTRPASISGKPVYAPISVTGNPASVSVRAVPPVESRRMPRPERPRAKSMSPVLSETDSRAWVMVATRQSSGVRRQVRRAGITARRSTDDVSANSVLAKLRPQSIAVEPEHVGGLRLIATGAMHDRRQQRSLDVRNHHVVDAMWSLPIEPAEIILERLLHTSPDFIGAIEAHGSFHAARASSTHGAAATVAGAWSSRSGFAASRSKKRFVAAIWAADVSSRLTS